MTNRAWPFDAVSGAPSYTGRALRQTQSPAIAGATSARPLGGRSGVRPGTPTTTVSATSTTWTVLPHAGVLDVETASEASVYWYALDANSTGSVTAANATNPRKDIICVRLDDPAEGDGSSVPAVVVTYTAGAAAASPTQPATPARSMLLAVINVPVSGGGSPTVTPAWPYAVGAGVPWPVRSDTERDALLTAVPGSVENPTAVRHVSSSNTRAGIVEYNDGTGWRPQIKAPRGVWTLASPTALTSGAFTVAPIATPVGTPDAGITNSGGAVTLARAGEYELTVVAVWNGTGGSRRALIATVNGSSIDGSGNVSGSGRTVGSQTAYPPGVDYAVTATFKFDAAAGDVLRLFVFHDAGVPISLNVGATNTYLGLTSITVRQIG